MCGILTKHISACPTVQYPLTLGDGGGLLGRFAVGVAASPVVFTRPPSRPTPAVVEIRVSIAGAGPAELTASCSDAGVSNHVRGTPAGVPSGAPTSAPGDERPDCPRVTPDGGLAAEPGGEAPGGSVSGASGGAPDGAPGEAPGGGRPGGAPSGARGRVVGEALDGAPT